MDGFMVGSGEGWHVVVSDGILVDSDGAIVGSSVGPAES